MTVGWQHTGNREVYHSLLLFRSSFIFYPVWQFLVYKENKREEEEDLPSIETLEISKKNAIQSIPSYFGGDEEEDIPDMGDFEDADNLIESDPVRISHMPLQ